MSRKQCSNCGGAQAVRPGSLCNRCYSDKHEPAKPESISLEKIRVDGGTQSRVSLDTAVVFDYQVLLNDGVKLPPIVVFFDGVEYWIADGFHRLHAHRAANKEEIDCLVKTGTRRDALLYAIGANASHGLRRSTEDKRKAVELLLADEEWGQRSTEWIAQTAKVSWHLANSVREGVQGEDAPKTVATADGKTYTAPMQTPARESELEEEESVEESIRTPARESEFSSQTDSTGSPVPKHLDNVFASVPSYKSILEHCTEIKAAINLLKKSEAGMHLGRQFQELSSDLSNVRNIVRFSMPYAVCPYCSKKVGVNCKACKGLGWVVESIWVEAPKGVKDNAA